LSTGTSRPPTQSTHPQGADISAAVIPAQGGSPQALNVTRVGSSNLWKVEWPAMNASSVQLELASTFPLKNLQLENGVTDITLNLHVPFAYPQVSPSSLSIRWVQGTAPVTRTLTLTGPSTGGGAGCVWLDSAKVFPLKGGPMSTKVTPASSKANCIHVGVHARKKVVVTIAPGSAATGWGKGNLTFALVPNNGERPLVTKLPVAFDVVSAPNVARAITVFVGLLLAGILLPIGLLALLNWIGARFQPPQLIRYLVADVTVDPSGEVAADDTGRPLDASPAAFVGAEHVLINEAAIRGERAFSVDRFTFATRTLGARGERHLSLLRGPYGVVSAGGRRVVAGSDPRVVESFDGAGTHEVPLGLAGTWVFLPEIQAEDIDDWDPSGQRSKAPVLRGRLLVLVPSEQTDVGETVRLNAGRRLCDAPELARALPGYSAGGSRFSFLGRLFFRPDKDDAEPSHDEADEPPLPTLHDDDDNFFKTRR